MYISLGLGLLNRDKRIAMDNMLFCNTKIISAADWMKRLRLTFTFNKGSVIERTSSLLGDETSDTSDALILLLLRLKGCLNLVHGAR